MESKDYEVDILELFKVIWGSKILISSIIIFISSFSVIYSLFIPNLYTSSALMEVSESQNSNGMQNLSSTYGGIASLAGISLPAGAVNKSDYVVETIKSRDFLKHLLEFQGVRENLFAAEKFNFSSKQISYDEEIFDSKNNKWLREPPSNRSKVPSYLEIYPIYRENLSISVDPDSQFINISFTHISPLFAYEFLDLIFNELNLLSKNKDLNESNLALNFLKDQLITVKENDVRKSISQLIQSQLEVKMLANARKDYLISYIDRAYVPEDKSSPKRFIILMVSILISFTFSSLYVVFRHYLFDQSSK